MEKTKKDEYRKMYYNKNKEKILATILKNKDKTIFCSDCKCNVKYFSLTSHRKTEKHKKNVEKMSNDKMTEEKILKVLRRLIDFS